MRQPVEGETIKCPVIKEKPGTNTYPEGKYNSDDHLIPKGVWEGTDKRKYGIIPPHDHGAYGSKREKCDYEGHVDQVEYKPKKD